MEEKEIHYERVFLLRYGLMLSLQGLIRREAHERIKGVLLGPKAVVSYLTVTSVVKHGEASRYEKPLCKISINSKVPSVALLTIVSKGELDVTTSLEGLTTVTTRLLGLLVMCFSHG